MTDLSAATRPTPSPASGLIWGLVSTALLAAYIAWNMGWVCALAGVVGVFVHEYGHVLAINALGSGPGRIHIIPFFGGAATMRTPPATDFKGVLIALAGPVFGLVAMAPFLVAYALTGDLKWTGGALFIAGINLLNLAPAPPLDGSKALGPALARIHPWLERGVLAILAALAVDWAISHRQVIIAGLIGLAAVRVVMAPGSLRPQSMKLTPKAWIATLALYAAAIGLCFGAVYAILAVGFDASGADVRTLLAPRGAR